MIKIDILYECNNVDKLTILFTNFSWGQNICSDVTEVVVRIRQSTIILEGKKDQEGSNKLNRSACLSDYGRPIVVVRDGHFCSRNLVRVIQ